MLGAIHELGNGSLEPIYKDVTNTWQIRSYLDEFGPQQTGRGMRKRPRSNNTPTFDKRLAFLETQPNPTPLNDHQRRLQTRSAALGTLILKNV